MEKFIKKKQEEFYFYYSSGSIEVLSENKAINLVNDLIKHGEISGITYDTASLKGFSNDSFKNWQSLSSATKTERHILEHEIQKHLGSSSRWEIIKKFEIDQLTSGTTDPLVGSECDFKTINFAIQKNLLAILSSKYHECAYAVNGNIKFLYRLSASDKSFLFERGEDKAKEDFRKKVGKQVKIIKK